MAAELQGARLDAALAVEREQIAVKPIEQSGPARPEGPGRHGPV